MREETPFIVFSKISEDFGPCKATKDKFLYKVNLNLFPSEFLIILKSLFLHAALRIIIKPFSTLVIIKSS